MNLKAQCIVSNKHQTSSVKRERKFGVVTIWYAARLLSLHAFNDIKTDHVPES